MLSTVKGCLTDAEEYAVIHICCYDSGVAVYDNAEVRRTENRGVADVGPIGVVHVDADMTAGSIDNPCCGSSDLSSREINAIPDESGLCASGRCFSPDNRQTE